MSEKVKQWIAIAVAVAALIMATIAAMRDGVVTADEAAVIKEKAGAVVDTFVNDGAAETAPVNVEQKGGE